MKTIKVPTRAEVSEESQISFDRLEKKAGRVASLYAVMGYSGKALKAFLDFDETLSKGSFRGKEREAIALIVSQVNGCEYCLAGHTAAALQWGFSIEETLSIRKGSTGTAKLDAIIQLAKSITENKGHADPVFLQAFYDAGFNESALMELIGLVTVRIYTNYVFAATAIPIDYPAALHL